jgi:sarcosine oxidase/sarcosine oxidase subunit beta
VDDDPPGQRLLRRDQHALGARPGLTPAETTAAALAARRPAQGGARRRALVIGGGIAGLCAAWALSRAGLAVTVVEARALPNPHGSSADDGRIIRHVYGTMEGYAAMMPAAHVAWARLFAATGHDRLIPVRALYVLREEGPWQAAAQRALDAAGMRLTLLDDSAIAALPMLNRDGVLRVAEVEGSGILQARAILDDLLSILRTAGATLRDGVEVAGLDPVAGSVTLRGGETMNADVLVVAAGTGVNSLLPGMARDWGLRASVQTLAYLEPPPRLAAAWQAGPMLLNRLSGHPTGGVYVLPPRHGARLKIGDYDTTAEADAGADHATLRADRVAALLDAGAQAIANFGDYRIAMARHCHYTMAHEDRFVVRQVGERGWLVSACSGHGFKLAPLIALGLVAAVDGAIDPGALAHWAAGHEGAHPDG